MLLLRVPPPVAKPRWSKGPCGTTSRFKIQFDPPKRPLRDAFPAQNTISSAQRPPAGDFSGSKYNFIRPKAPCGMLFQLKIQFYPPKSPLRDAFLAQKFKIVFMKNVLATFCRSDQFKSFHTCVQHSELIRSTKSC